MDGTVLGYDPGGNDKHGVARVVVETGTATSASVDTMPTAEHALLWLSEGDAPFGIGVDTLTAWCTGPGGWRPADKYLRARYPDVANSVISPNGLFGSMPLNGLSVILELARKWPEILVSETHPKVLYYALTGRPYEWADNLTAMTTTLLGWLGLEDAPELKTDHEWDALASAFAMIQGLKGAWTRDLLRLPLGEGRRMIHPVGETRYHWPD